MGTNADGELIGTGEFCRRAGITTTLAYRLEARGYLKPVRLQGAKQRAWRHQDVVSVHAWKTAKDVVRKEAPERARVRGARDTGGARGR